MKLAIQNNGAYKVKLFVPAKVPRIVGEGEGAYIDSMDEWTIEPGQSIEVDGRGAETLSFREFTPVKDLEVLPSYGV